MNLSCKCVLFLLLSSYCDYITYGASNSIEGRITGGYKAQPHSNPYVVSLQTRYLWKRYRLCNGAILSQQWILSAGHCVTDSRAKWSAMDAIVGAHNLATITSSQIYSISRRIAHPKYRGDVGPYDISMMKTSRKIEYSENVQPISLPVTNPQFDENEKLLLTGWGALYTSLFYTVLPNKLREVQVTYLPYNECYRAVNNFKDKYEHNPLRREANICTGPIYGGISGCVGDSGGPLVQYVSCTIDEETTYAETTGTDEKEETTTAMSSSISPIPMTTDRTSTTTSQTHSPTPMTTDRTSTTTTKTYSPTPMTTDRTSTTTTNTYSPIPMTTDRTSTTTTRTDSPIPMTTDRTSTTTTDRTSTTTTNTNSPTPMTTDRTSTAILKTYSLIPMTTDRKSTTTKKTFSPIPMPTDRKITVPAEINNLRGLRVDMVPIIVGVLSWGVVPCGDRGAPTVYSNVSNYLDFINHYLYSN